jgi:hypothetical protein
MKNIIDIYESILTSTKSKLKSVKDEMDFNDLKQFDNTKYKTLFDIGKLERIQKHFLRYGYRYNTDRELVINTLNSYLVLFVDDEDVIKLFMRIYNIIKQGRIIDYWTWYYESKDDNKICTCDTLKPIFKQGIIYDKFSKDQLEEKEKAPKYFNLHDNSDMFMPIYDNKNMWWMFVPKGLSGYDKILMENFMKLLAKYNR